MRESVSVLGKETVDGVGEREAEADGVEPAEREAADASGEGDGVAGVFNAPLEPEAGESAGKTEGLTEGLAEEAELDVSTEPGEGESLGKPEGVAEAPEARGKEPVRWGS